MSSVPLARLIDPGALDRSDRARGRLTLAVPVAWLRQGARFEADLPDRLRCDLCDGGGCDRCGRSGGYRLPQGRPPLAITLPRVEDDRYAVRITNPVGDADPSILVVEVIGGESAPSPGVRWLAAHHTPSLAPPSVAPKVPATSTLLAPFDPGSWSARAITIGLAVLLGLLTRWC